MNTFLQMFAFSEDAGGLFDFNGTLPLMALQFILLTTALTFLFYKPVSQILEKRETFINGNLANASEKLLKANELCQQYEEQLKEAKLSAQAIVTKAPSFSKFENLIEAFFLSRRVFPIKVPSPKPALELKCSDLVVI